VFDVPLSCVIALDISASHIGATRSKTFTVGNFNIGSECSDPVSGS
jgi:hypothetical protein